MSLQTRLRRNRKDLCFCILEKFRQFLEYHLTQPTGNSVKEMYLLRKVIVLNRNHVLLRCGLSFHRMKEKPFRSERKLLSYCQPSVSVSNNYSQLVSCPKPVAGMYSPSDEDNAVTYHSLVNQKTCSRYGRKFCFVNFKPKGSKKTTQKSSNSRTSLDQLNNTKAKENKKIKAPNKKQKRQQTKLPSMTRSSYYARLSQYERMSSSSTSSVLSTDSMSSDSDSDDSIIVHRERGPTNGTGSCPTEDVPTLLTTTDESDSDFSESDISSILSPWSSTESSTSEAEEEREFEFYSEPDSNRQSTDSSRMPVFTDFIYSLGLPISEFLPLSIQVVSETLLRNFGDEVGWGPCPNCIVDILLRRRLSQEDVAESPACAICCADFKAEEEVIDLPCKHYYHTDCICSWLKIRSTCPACRFDVCSLSDLPETEV